MINFSGAANRTYRVQVTSSLASPVEWRNVSTHIASADGTWQFIDPSSGGLHARFFRVATQ